MKNLLRLTFLFLFLVSGTNMHAMAVEQQKRKESFSSRYGKGYLEKTEKELCAAYKNCEYMTVSGYSAELVSFFTELSILSKLNDGFEVSEEYAKIAELWKCRAALCLQPDRRPITGEYFLQAHPGDTEQSSRHGDLEDPLYEHEELKSIKGALFTAHTKNDKQAMSRLCRKLVEFFKTISKSQRDPVILHELGQMVRLWEHRSLMVLGNKSPQTFDYLCQAFPEQPKRKITR